MIICGIVLISIGGYIAVIAYPNSLSSWSSVIVGAILGFGVIGIGLVSIIIGLMNRGRENKRYGE